MANELSLHPPRSPSQSVGLERLSKVSFDLSSTERDETPANFTSTQSSTKSMERLRRFAFVSFLSLVPSVGRCPPRWMDDLFVGKPISSERSSIDLSLIHGQQSDFHPLIRSMLAGEKNSQSKSLEGKSKRDRNRQTTGTVLLIRSDLNEKKD